MPLSQPIHLEGPTFEHQNGNLHFPETTVNNLETEPNPNIKWGSLTNYTMIKREIDAAYNELVKWEKNFFELPKGKIGKEFIQELTRLLQLMNNKTAWENLAVSLIHIFLPIMLQKPAAKSKRKDHVRYLTKRMEMWKSGKLKELLAECKTIQQRMLKTKNRQLESNAKGFTKLMLQGKVKQALKLVNEDNDITGVHELDDEIRMILESKHPPAEPITEEAIVQNQLPRTPVESVIFEEINASSIKDAARNTFGSGGPTKVDSDVWKFILCSKSFGNHPDLLCEEIAIFTRQLCTEQVPQFKIEKLLSNRLVPLKKQENGVRPVGVGETLRRIMGKSISRILKDDIQTSSGTLQTCAGLESGIEAAIHAMRETFEQESCEAVLLVDADNAFNRLNREVALKNIEQLCPPLYQYLFNSYNTPSKLYLKDGTYILSKEGVTQGDNLATGKYSVATRPLINELSECIREENAKQVWFADDSTAAGKLQAISIWWKELKEKGPKYGYYPKPSKTYLIVKNKENTSRAQALFRDVNITCEGERHIGAVLGTEEFKNSYVTKKVDAWTRDLKELAEIAKEEPQAALSAFNMGLSRRWSFIQRTVKDISHLFDPLEHTIRNQLIPAIVGRPVSNIERQIISLPYRYGGLGIQNPVETAETEFDTSIQVTEQLTKLIILQDMDVKKLDKPKIKETKAKLKSDKEEALKQKAIQLSQQLPAPQKRSLITAQEKGASSWLSTLPIKTLGYALNKQEFRDAISLRYGWKIKDAPMFCVCGEQNSVDHALVCKRGGYVSMRHNALRDTEATLMKEVCRDVQIEPTLLPTSNELRNGTIISERARLDISARGLHGQNEKTFFDVRVTHPNSESNKEKSLEQIYKQHEAEKKRSYNDRIIQVEKASFVPLVFTTTGGFSPECERLNKKLADKIANKRNESYASVIKHIRTRLRFALLRSTLVALRGTRGKIDQRLGGEDLEHVSFNLIPEGNCYEA